MRVLLLGLVVIWASSWLMVRAGLTPLSKRLSFAGLVVATAVGITFGVGYVAVPVGIVPPVFALATLQFWVAVFAPGAVLASLWAILLSWVWSLRCLYRVARGATTFSEIGQEIVRAFKGVRE